jgi:hypothetical protein
MLSWLQAQITPVFTGVRKRHKIDILVLRQENGIVINIPLLVAVVLPVRVYCRCVKLNVTVTSFGVEASSFTL